MSTRKVTIRSVMYDKNKHRTTLTGVSFYYSGNCNIETNDETLNERSDRFNDSIRDTDLNVPLSFPSWSYCILTYWRFIHERPHGTTHSFPIRRASLIIIIGSMCSFNQSNFHLLLQFFKHYILLTNQKFSVCI